MIRKRAIELSRRPRQRKILLALSILLIASGIALILLYFYWYFTGNKVVDLDLPAGPFYGSNQSEDLDIATIEEPVTEAKIREHHVPANRPRYLSIADLGVTKNRILSVGVDKDGHIGTPVNIYDVGWYNASGMPGAKDKVIFLDGHNGGPTKDGIFKRLPTLSNGSIIELERGDGQIFRYKVSENYNLATEKFDNEQMQKIFTPINSQETLAIVSCTGKWIQSIRDYSDRVVVRAVRID